jgi:AcrR family transcriptional regulator
MTLEQAEAPVEERARRIIESTIELAEEGGFEAVRLRDVAARAEVALGTLYRRFRSKEELLVAALEQETRGIEARVHARPPKGATAGERAIGFFELATRGMLRRPHLSRAMIRCAATGEPALARKVGLFHDMMRGMIVGAMRDEAMTAEAAPMSDRERLLGDVLDHVWFALMVGWSGGLETQATIQEQMRATVELVLGERTDGA